jgi:hypothetical protein
MPSEDLPLESANEDVKRRTAGFPGRVLYTTTCTLYSGLVRRPHRFSRGNNARTIRLRDAKFLWTQDRPKLTTGIGPQGRVMRHIKILTIREQAVCRSR